MTEETRRQAPRALSAQLRGRDTVRVDAAAPDSRRMVVFATPLSRLSSLSTLFWVVLSIGALLRLATLGLQSFWLDEAITFWTIHRDLAALADMLSIATRPLFFFVLYPFYLLSASEWMLRLPSALAGTASLALLYALGRELFSDRRTALLAAALLALSPLHLWYSQEARFYALGGLISTSAVFFAVRGLKYNRSRDWVLFGLFEGLGLWNESGGIWLILALNIAGLLLARRLLREGRIFGWALAQAVGVLVYLPRLGAFVSSVQGGTAGWIPPATILQVLRLLSDFAGGFMQPAWFGVLSLLLVGSSLLLAAALHLRQVRRDWLAYAVLLPWLLVPISASFVISQPYYRPDWLLEIIGTRPSVFLTRNLITILFPLLLLAGRSLVLLYQQKGAAWQRASMVLAAGILVLYSFGYFNNHLTLRKEDYRSAAAVAASAAAEADLVLTSPGYLEQPVSYYYFQDERLQNLSLASVRDGVVDSLLARQDSERLRLEVPDLPALILQHERVWLITNQNVNQPPDLSLVEYLEESAALIETSYHNGVIVRLYVLDKTGAAQP